MIEDTVSELARLALKFIGLFAAISGVVLLVLGGLSILELQALGVGLFFLVVAAIILLLFLSEREVGDEI